MVFSIGKIRQCLPLRTRTDRQMARLCVLPLLFLLFFGVAKAEDEKGSVYELTDATIDAAIAKHDYIFIDFYAPWCFHCKELSPELDAAAPVLAENVPPIILAKLNADKYRKIASRYYVSGYPTLKFFINGYPQDYNGPRKAAYLTTHLLKLTTPDVKVLDNATALHDFLTNADDIFPFFIGFGVDRSLLSGFGKEYKSKAWFLVVESFSEKIMERFDFDKGPALVAVRRRQNEQEIFYGPFEGDDLAAFIKQNILPRVNQLTSESLQTLREDGRPIALAILFDEFSEQSISFIRMLRAAAPANRAFVFAYVDALKWPSFVESFDFDVKTKGPAFLVWTGDSTYFVSAEGYDFASERAETYATLFLQEYKEGNAKELSMKGPSFTDFLWSLVSVRSVYILILITVVIVFAQTMFASDSDYVQRRQSEQEEINSVADRHTSRESGVDAPHDTIKED